MVENLGLEGHEGRFYVGNQKPLPPQKAVLKGECNKGFDRENNI